VPTCNVLLAVLPKFSTHGALLPVFQQKCTSALVCAIGNTFYHL
jgi:hypothetical protein